MMKCLPQPLWVQECLQSQRGVIALPAWAIAPFELTGGDCFRDVLLARIKLVLAATRGADSYLQLRYPDKESMAAFAEILNKNFPKQECEIYYP